MNSQDRISDKDIEQGLAVAARLVDRYGDQFWPAFRRLEDELEKRQVRAAKIKVYLHER